jgi:hypothetical protein
MIFGREKNGRRAARAGYFVLEFHQPTPSPLDVPGSRSESFGVEVQWKEKEEEGVWY